MPRYDEDTELAISHQQVAERKRGTTEGMVNRTIRSRRQAQESRMKPGPGRGNPLSGAEAERKLNAEAHKRGAGFHAKGKAKPKGMPKAGKKKSSKKK